jgi:hypothetical protein
MDATLIIGLVVASALLALLVVMLVRRTVVATVAGFFWQRRVELEQHAWVEESSYWGYPEGSRNQHSTRETYFTNEITSQITTTTTNADGTPSTTTQPVYQMVPPLANQISVRNPAMAQESRTPHRGRQACRYPLACVYA